VRAAFLARRRPVEEGEIGARPRLAVGIKQVIRGNIVLVDGLLDQPHAEHLFTLPGASAETAVR
jgi:hypothetical protein